MTCWDDTGESSLLRVFFFVLGSSLILGSSEHIDTILWDLQGKVREVIRDTDGRGGIPVDTVPVIPTDAVPPP